MKVITFKCSVDLYLIGIIYLINTGTPRTPRLCSLTFLNGPPNIILLGIISIQKCSMYHVSSVLILAMSYSVAQHTTCMSPWNFKFIRCQQYLTICKNNTWKLCNIHASNIKLSCPSNAWRSDWLQGIQLYFHTVQKTHGDQLANNDLL